MQITNKTGDVVRRSRNLAGLLRHAREHPIRDILIRMMPDAEGEMTVKFKNRDTCRTRFASYTVMCEWVLNRRSWAGAEVQAVTAVRKDDPDEVTRTRTLGRILPGRSRTGNMKLYLAMLDGGD